MLLQSINCYECFFNQIPAKNIFFFHGFFSDSFIYTLFQHNMVGIFFTFCIQSSIQCFLPTSEIFHTSISVLNLILISNVFPQFGKFKTTPSHKYLNGFWFWNDNMMVKGLYAYNTYTIDRRVRDIDYLIQYITMHILSSAS